MLRARIIPSLLIQRRGLVKTTRFTNPQYVGDPLNAVRIFNEKQVDELIILDIDATVNGREPDYDLIASLASECRMPLCYGGGVKTVHQVERIISLGVEKICISSAAALNPNLITKASQQVGNQSIVVALDVKKSGLFGRYDVFTHNGTKRLGRDPVDMAKQLAQYGAGEILLNSIDRDGTMNGYDLDLIDAVKGSVSLPLTALGGASSYDDLRSLVTRFGAIGVAAGSIFVFKGKYRAVLIQYPQLADKDHISFVG